MLSPPVIPLEYNLTLHAKMLLLYNYSGKTHIHLIKLLAAVYRIAPEFNLAFCTVEILSYDFTPSRTQTGA